MNICLISGIIILVGYFVVGLFQQYQLPECKAGVFKTTNESAIHENPQFSVYQNVLSKRNLFGAPIGKKVVKTLSISASQMLSKLSLIGIISVDGKPQALIRDKGSRKDYFCTGGEIIGIFKVEKVLGDKVILKFEDEELELKL